MSKPTKILKSETGEAQASDVEEQRRSEFGTLATKCDRYSLSLRQVSIALSDSLRTEFAPNDVSVADWRHSLTLFHRCVSPLIKSVDRLWQLDSQQTGIRARLAVEVDRAIQDSVKSLFSRDGNPSERLGKARAKLRRVVTGLELWKQNFPKSLVADELVGPPMESSLLRFLKPDQLRNRYFSELSHQARLRNDADDRIALTNQCMASRKLYIVGLVVGCAFPDQWGLSEFGRFEQLHCRLLENIRGASHYRSSIRWRLEKARQSSILNPNIRFNRHQSEDESRAASLV